MWGARTFDTREKQWCLVPYGNSSGPWGVTFMSDSSLAASTLRWPSIIFLNHADSDVRCCWLISWIVCPSLCAVTRFPIICRNAHMQHVVIHPIWVRKARRVVIIWAVFVVWTLTLKISALQFSFWFWFDRQHAFSLETKIQWPAYWASSWLLSFFVDYLPLICPTDRRGLDCWWTFQWGRRS